MYKPVLIIGSLQTHAVMVRVHGGYSPCIGTTDFGLPRVIEVCDSGTGMEITPERSGL